MTCKCITHRLSVNIHQRSLILGCLYQGFLGGSVGKESTCNAEDKSLIPGLGRSPGGGHGNPLQYSCWRIPWTEEPGRLQSIGLQRIRHDWSNWAHTTFIISNLLQPTTLSLNTSEERQISHSLASIFFFSSSKVLGYPVYKLISDWICLSSTILDSVKKYNKKCSILFSKILFSNLGYKNRISKITGAWVRS